MGGFSRRDFLKRTAASSVAGGIALSGIKVAEASTGETVGTMIDLTKCDGCKGKDVPDCVSACRTENKDKFPEPVEDIGNYWPQKKFEDWSEKRGLTK